MSNEKKFRKLYLPLFRRIVQLLCFFFLPALFIQIFSSIKTILFFFFHQQGTFSSIVPSLGLLAVVTIVTVIFGRFFCGFMCAFGSCEDFIYHFPRFILRKKTSKQLMPSLPDAILKYLKYVVLAFFLIPVWGMQIVSIPTGTDPWELFGMLLSFGNWPSAGTIAASWLTAAILLVLLFVASAFVERFFCRYLCPLGAYFSLISKIRPFAIKKDRSNCGKCSLCSVKCSMGIPLSKMDLVTSGECIDCMECIKCCPSDNAVLDLDDRKKNAIVAGTVSCTLIAGSYYLGNIYESAVSTSAVTSAESVSAGAYSNLADGTYTGTGTGFRGETTVSVDIENGTITNISIVSYADDDEYLNRASSSILSEIIESQSTDVDTVSGATYSSNGIIEAVANALSENTSAEDSTAASGDENAAGKTDDSTMPEDGSAAPSADENSSTDADTANDSAASDSSSSASLSDIADGTYTGSGTGLRGETDVTVTVKDGAITDITIDSYQDDQEFFERAESTIIDEILQDQSVDVDAVSGATYSSNSIKEAVADALGLSFTPSEVQNEGHGGGHGGFQH